MAMKRVSCNYYYGTSSSDLALPKLIIVTQLSPGANQWKQRTQSTFFLKKCLLRKNFLVREGYHDMRILKTSSVESKALLLGGLITGCGIIGKNWLVCTSSCLAGMLLPYLAGISPRGNHYSFLNTVSVRQKTRCNNRLIIRIIGTPHTVQICTNQWIALKSR